MNTTCVLVYNNQPSPLLHIYKPGSTVMKSSLAGVPLKNKFSAVTNTVKFSHDGSWGASTVSFGWSTVLLNNAAELLFLTSTKYLKVRSLLGGIPIALSLKAIQEMRAVTGAVSSTSMTTERPLGVLGGSEKDGVSQSNEGSLQHADCLTKKI